MSSPYVEKVYSVFYQASLYFLQHTVKPVLSGHQTAKDRWSFNPEYRNAESS